MEDPFVTWGGVVRPRVVWVGAVVCRVWIGAGLGWRPAASVWGAAVGRWLVGRRLKGLGDSIEGKA